MIGAGGTTLVAVVATQLMFRVAFADVIDVPARPGQLNRAVEALTASSADNMASRKTTLRLEPGRHQLLRPLDLHAAHSGLRFEGAPSGDTVISGGVEIPPSSWKVYAPAKCAGCGSVMRAPLAAGTNYSRQLYVNGERANWTMGLFPQKSAKITSTGYSVPVGTFDWKHNGGAKIEMVYRGTHSSGAQWTESRVPATAYDSSTGHITMAPAGFAAGNNKAYNQHLTLPEYYQNVFELLGDETGGNPGDWYLDLDEKGEGYIYFVTSKESDDASASIHAVLPQLQLLVNGTPGLKDISWSDVTFSDATWLLPSSDVGFVEMQAGCTLRGASPPAGHKDWYDDSLWMWTTGNVLLQGVSGARFERCTFKRLGACGVSFEGGSQNNSITHSEFTDISASAVSIGRTNTYNITDRSLHDADNTVSDCRIRNVATEFHGAPAVAVFYSRGTSLVHNEISLLPYTAVSIGWGWGRTMEIVWPGMPWDEGNDISYNNIHDVMMMLGDGGSIYTLGPQGNVPFPKGPSGKVYPSTPLLPLKALAPSTMIGNYIHDTGPTSPDAPGAGSHFPGGLYNDEGTTNWAMVGNVIVDTPAWLQGCRFPDGWIGHMNQTGNFIACDSHLRHAQGGKKGCTLINANTTVADCVVSDNQVFSSRETMPPAAQVIMKSAGPRSSY